jgi:hypothetical protein
MDPIDQDESSSNEDDELVGNVNSEAPPIQENLNFFDEELRIIIEKNQPELNEVQEFITKLSNHNLKTKKQQLFKNFWNLLCCTIGGSQNGL